MKCFVAVLLLALFAVAMAATTSTITKESELKPPLKEQEETARSKRDYLYGSYGSQLAYSSYVPSYGNFYQYGYPYSYSYPYNYYNRYPYYYGSQYGYA